MSSLCCSTTGRGTQSLLLASGYHEKSRRLERAKRSACSGSLFDVPRDRLYVWEPGGEMAGWLSVRFDGTKNLGRRQW